MASDVHIEDTGNPAYEPLYAQGKTNFQNYTTLMNSRGYPLNMLIGDDWQDSDENMALAQPLVAALNNHQKLIGNHDAGYVDPAKWPLRKVSIPTNFGMPGLYYAFDLGTFIRVICLCSSFDNTDTEALYADYTGYLGTAQLNWLSSELVSSASKKMVLVMVHHPPRATGSPAAMGASDVTALTTLLNSRENVYLFAGHDHPPNMTSAGFGAKVSLRVLAAMAEQPTWYLCTAILKASGNTEFTIVKQTL